ncbi:hypothetical protein ACF0H5_001543 [Mactra antiquata]
MKSFNGRLLKSFIWIIGVGFLTIAVISIHELVLKPPVKFQPIVQVEKSAQILDKVILAPQHVPTVQKNVTTVKITNPPIQEINVTTKKTTPLPGQHFGFLKVHKAASTTTQAIFLRYGWRRKLTFMLPPEYNSFGYPNIISINESLTQYNILPPPAGKQFDILCHHVVFGERAWDSYLPSDTLFSGTVREPFSLFKSTLNYFNPRSVARAQEKNASDPIGTFLRNPQLYDGRNVRYVFTNNRLAFEYGVEPDIIIKRDLQAFDKYLHNVLDKRFAVVILAELYDESLIMLKRKLGWELNDVLYVTKNVRSVSKADRYNMSEVHKPLHREYAIFDYLLYEFFEQRLRRQIEEAGDGFHHEVGNFINVRKYVENFCHTTPKNIMAVKVQKTDWNEEFEITRDDCDIMHKGEIQFTQMIRKEQYGTATWTGPGRKPPVIVKSKPKQAGAAKR